MRRITGGLYTEGRWVVTKDCYCSARDCGSRWTLRELESVSADGWPTYGSQIWDSSSTLAGIVAGLSDGR